MALPNATLAAMLEPDDPWTMTRAERQALWVTWMGRCLPVIVLSGLVGNVLTLMVFSRRKHFTGITYFVLRAMALADFVAMLALILWVANWWGLLPKTDLWVAVWKSHVDSVLLNTMLVCSAILVVVLSVERYLAVCLPTRRLLTPLRARLTVILIFVCVVGSFLPTAFLKWVDVIGNETIGIGYKAIYNNDVLDSEWYPVYVGARVALFKLLPVVVVVTLNTVTFIKFRQTVRRRRTLVSTASTHSARPGQRNSLTHTGAAPNKSKNAQETRLMILLLCTASIYVVCLLPMAVLFVLDRTKIFSNHSNRAYNAFQIVANLLEYFNSAANFYVYCLASRDFRLQLTDFLRGALRLLTCGKYTPSRHYHSSTRRESPVGMTSLGTNGDASRHVNGGSGTAVASTATSVNGRTETAPDASSSECEMLLSDRRRSLPTSDTTTTEKQTGSQTDD